MNRVALRIEIFLRRLLTRPRLDLPLLIALLLLAGMGLFFLSSAAELAWRTIGAQAARFMLGFVLLYVVSRIPPAQFRRWSPALYAFSILLLILVLVLGEGRGADRWLNLGIVRFQPSELLKLTTPMMAAWYLAQRPLPPSWRDLGVVLLLIALPAD
ncbi:Cell cycle protein [mine drainage metagenome]|uniref:Cell cycle protein n=1 Tax=mine drainage metagenome TaxID=410659 RepID=T1CIX8_9ZZZZ